MKNEKPLSKVSKIWICAIAFTTIVIFSLIYVFGMHNTEVKVYSDPYASGPAIPDSTLDRPTALSTPVPDFKAPAAQGLVGEEKPELAKDPSSFIEIKLPFAENQGIQVGDGFILSAFNLEPDMNFTSRIYIDGETPESDTAFDSHVIKADALGIIDSPFALPTNLSVGKYVLELSNPNKSFQIHFTVIKTGEQHAGV